MATSNEGTPPSDREPLQRETLFVYNDRHRLGLLLVVAALGGVGVGFGLATMAYQSRGLPPLARVAPFDLAPRATPSWLRAPRVAGHVHAHRHCGPGTAPGAPGVPRPARLSSFASRAGRGGGGREAPRRGPSPGRSSTRSPRGSMRAPRSGRPCRSTFPSPLPSRASTTPSRFRIGAPPSGGSTTSRRAGTRSAWRRPKGGGPSTSTSRPPGRR